MFPGFTDLFSFSSQNVISIYNSTKADNEAINSLSPMGAQLREHKSMPLLAKLYQDVCVLRQQKAESIR